MTIAAWILCLRKTQGSARPLLNFPTVLLLAAGWSTLLCMYGAAKHTTRTMSECLQLALHEAGTPGQQQLCLGQFWLAAVLPCDNYYC
jgi:hypothetical protein